SRYCRYTMGMINIEGNDLVNYVTNNKKVVIIGADYSGKTTLAKKLYMEFSNQGLVPILIEGSLIKAVDEEKCLKLIEKTFCDQYDEILLEKYSQLENSRKIILIDDFNKSNLNMKGKICLITILGKFADRIILFNNDLFPLEEVLGKKEDAKSLLKFKICEIMELGYFLREKVIENWLSLGQKFTINEDELIHKINGSTKFCVGKISV
ncbi:MAG TPA: hypothetical protein ACFYEK_13315, partial [Candidatus Wunengus sp. YC60]